MSSPNLPLRASRSSATSQDQQQQPDINAEVAGKSPDDGNTKGDEETYADQNENGDLPMSMTASVILTNLPKDASAALNEVEEMDERKGTSAFDLLRRVLGPSATCRAHSSG